MTKLEATYKWTNEFNAINQEMLMPYLDNGTLEEVTPPASGDRVYVDGIYEDGYGEILSCDDESRYTIRLDDNNRQVQLEESDFLVDYDYSLPMWSTMWSFGNLCDEWWLEDQDGIRIMSECGFRIYRHEDFGYFFGIDGAGYDFYEEHWVPLYEKRGLKWHERNKGNPVEKA